MQFLCINAENQHSNIYKHIKKHINICKIKKHDFTIPSQDYMLKICHKLEDKLKSYSTVISKYCKDINNVIVNLNDNSIPFELFISNLSLDEVTIKTSIKYTIKHITKNLLKLINEFDKQNELKKTLSASYSNIFDDVGVTDIIKENIDYPHISTIYRINSDENLNSDITSHETYIPETLENMFKNILKFNIFYKKPSIANIYTFEEICDYINKNKLSIKLKSKDKCDDNLVTFYKFINNDADKDLILANENYDKNSLVKEHDNLHKFQIKKCNLKNILSIQQLLELYKKNNDIQSNMKQIEEINEWLTNNQGELLKLYSYLKYIQIFVEASLHFPFVKNVICVGTNINNKDIYKNLEIREYVWSDFLSNIVNHQLC